MENSAAPNLFPCEIRTDGRAWREAEAAGHDMSLIVETLRLPVEERLRRNDDAISAIMASREAFLKKYGGSGLVESGPWDIAIQPPSAILEATPPPHP